MQLHNIPQVNSLLSTKDTILFETNPGITKEPDYKAILSNCLVNVNDLIPVPPICIEIIVEDVHHTFGTLGNFSLIIGKAKAGKSFALSLILAAALTNGTTFQKVLRANFPEDKRTILYFDTEQSRYHVHKALKRICTISGVPMPQDFFVYSLRAHTPSERLAIIDFAINNTSNVGIVVIDGIRDLVTSINDEEQACMITSKLLKWTDDLIFHMITVLHQNKGDLNARGHLGTELTNKSETVISVCKGEDKNVSVIAAEYCRDTSFGTIGFSIDLAGLPSFVDCYAETSVQGQRRKKRAPYDVASSTHSVIIKDVFSNQSEMRRSELKTAASANISRYLGYDIGQNKAEEWITHWLLFNHIVRKGTPGTKACKYSIKYD